MSHHLHQLLLLSHPDDMLEHSTENTNSEMEWAESQNNYQDSVPWNVLSN